MLSEQFMEHLPIPAAPAGARQAVAERADWERYLQAQAGAYRRLGGEIVAGEKALDREADALYDLGPAEVAQVEKATAYEYGET